MKILKLRFKNLNSLYGEWEIDFRAQEYEEDSIFAITGPTGSGKTTLLDAICLALYGRTPRLDSVNKSGNEIMSRLSAKCFAEVLYETKKGIFQCHWSQHRARGKVNGMLSDSKHEISNVSGTLLATKKKEVARWVEDTTGMNFDRFTRSILLAQGRFSAFLQAKADEKAPILEQITGTEIYSLISKKVHESMKEEKNKLDLLTTELSEIDLKSEEELSVIKNEINELEKKNNKFSDTLKKTQNQISWVENIEKLEEELTRKENEKSELAEEEIKFSSKRNQLENAEKASSIDPYYDHLNNEREKQKKRILYLEDLEKKLPIYKKELLKSKNDFDKACNEEKKLMDFYELEKVKIQKTLEYDLVLKERKDVLEKKHGEVISTKEEIKRNDNQLAALKNKINKIENKQNEIAKFLLNGNKLEKLNIRFSGIEVKLNKLEDIKLLINEKDEILSKFSDKKKVIEKKKMKLKVEYEKKSRVIEKINVLLKQDKEKLEKILKNRTISEYEKEIQGLYREKGLVKTIINLKEERKALINGKPCPLCGSLEHPFSSNRLPSLSPIEKKLNELEPLVKEAKRISLRINEQKEKNHREVNNLKEIEKEIAITDNHRAQVNEYMKRTTNEIKREKEDYHKDEKDIIDVLNECGFDNIDMTNSERLIKEIKTRLKEWIEKKELRDKYEEERKRLGFEINRLSDFNDNLKSILLKKELEAKQKQEEWHGVQKERIALYENKDPKKEDMNIRRKIKENQTALEELRNKNTIKKEKIQELKARIQALTEEMASLSESVEKSYELFKDKLMEIGFENEHDYLKYKIEPSEKERLRLIADRLDRRRKENTITINNLSNRIKDERAKEVTKEPLTSLKSEYEEIYHELKENGEKSGELKRIIKDQEIERDRFKEKIKLKNKQEKEYSRWEELHYLIGSSDGKKYRNYAQGITFEIMIAHANKQLQKMSGRYLLLKDLKNPLELSVIDNDQAGETRSVKNLSGGENFVVSLSLALGLAKMAGKKINVDSLFLDEGFGTLDEDALETALDALANLKREGKLIGVISHVPSLKERIGTRINVIPISGGRSIIQGPGCIKNK